MSRPHVVTAAVIASIVATLAAPAEARAQEPVPTSAPGCVYFVPATTSSPPHCVPVRREPGPLEGLNAVGYTGAGLALGGIVTTGVGLAIALSGVQDRDTSEDMKIAGGVTAGVGVLMIVVGAPMWVLGKDDERATKIGIGAGSVNVAGTF